MANRRWPLLAFASPLAIAAALPACETLDETSKAIVCDDTAQPDCADETNIEVE